MPDPALEKSLAELRAVVKRLNEESDTLNARITEFESMLVELGPGVTAWAPKPLRVDDDGSGSQVGFLKFTDQWGLWLLRGKYTKSGDKWNLADGPRKGS